MFSVGRGVTWMSEEAFLPLKTLRPGEQNQLFGIPYLDD